MAAKKVTNSKKPNDRAQNNYSKRGDNWGKNLLRKCPLQSSLNDFTCYFESFLNFTTNLFHFKVIPTPNTHVILCKCINLGIPKHKKS